MGSYPFFRVKKIPTIAAIRMMGAMSMMQPNPNSIRLINKNTTTLLSLMVSSILVMSAGTCR